MIHIARFNSSATASNAPIQSASTRACAIEDCVSCPCAHVPAPPDPCPRNPIARLLSLWATIEPLGVAVLIERDANLAIGRRRRERKRLAFASGLAKAKDQLEMGNVGLESLADGCVVVLWGHATNCIT